MTLKIPGLNDPKLKVAIEELPAMIVDKLVHINVYEGIPIHVIPLRTDEREKAMQAEIANGLQPLSLYE